MARTSSTLYGTSIKMKRTLQILSLLACCGGLFSGLSVADEGSEFFTSKVEPLLRQRCYECHSHEKAIKGGLALDSRSGWENGGEGGPVVVPGAPEKSRLMTAVRFTNDDLQMPPKKKLADDEIAVLEQWVSQGAPDPRSSLVGSKKTPGQEWESLFHARLDWWSLQPVTSVNPPEVRAVHWPRNEVDNFILARLEAKGLKPVAEADRRILARRLSFVLTGLPPKSEILEQYVTSTSPHADEELVQSLIDSPSYGEHWARHWMDVVHYSDTHGYEWDVPAKNAWMYRDYLIRAFNADVPFQQLILEQIAGDLIEPRVDPHTGLNESILGPMAMRLGERRHGDNSNIEGITQEAISNVIDTISKGFLATTVGCAQCHDHKLDAVEQRDYYGLAGILMSTRWGVRCADTSDPNLQPLDELKQIKADIRGELHTLWKGTKEPLAEKILALSMEAAAKSTDANAKAKVASTPQAGFPDSLTAIWRRLVNASTADNALEADWTSLANEFKSQRENRITENKANLRLLADFTREELPPGWQFDGFGMKHGLTRDGEIVVAEEGDSALAHLLPAGRWSHVWSTRLAGAVRSPMFGQAPPPTFSVGYAGGKCGAISLVVDQSFHGESVTFLNKPTTGWRTFTAGNFPAIAGGVSQTPRRVYLELATKSLNNNFPPRVGLGGAAESEINDDRSWIGVTRVYEHAAGKSPQDELGRFTSLFANPNRPRTKEELAANLAEVIFSAVDRWNSGQCDSEDVKLINEALTANWLVNESAATPVLALLIKHYRDVERRLRPDHTIGSVADWNEGHDERIGVRGSYTDFGDEVPRGNVRFLGGPAALAHSQSSGRLEFALNLASDRNPLTARVIVNRVWHHLFGTGLVRTPDDFGHLGEQPSHPELLDFLAARFMADGWSVKKLVTLLVTSATWRQSSISDAAAVAIDAENRLWHHMPMRRLEAESVRDSLLAVAGRLDPTLYGPPIDPPRVAQDAAKRLSSGPLDGNGRRSLYIKMTLMEPPRFLAIFNQPIPKLTVGKRDATNVPDQALALLNDPFVIAMANYWSKRVSVDESVSPEARVQRMFATAFARPPTSGETDRLLKLVSRSAQIRRVEAANLMKCEPLWQDVAHAMFNLKEFIYVQ